MTDKPSRCRIVSSRPGSVRGWAGRARLPERLTALGLPRRRRPAVEAARQVGAPAGVQPRQGQGPVADDPALRELSRDGMRSYFRYFHEVFRLPLDGHATRSSPACTSRRRARSTTTWPPGRGVVLALPHMGNWDQAGAWVTGTGDPFTTVAERLKPESLFDRFVAYREGLGMEVLPLTGGDGPFGTLARRLRAGRPGLPARRPRPDRDRRRGRVLRRGRRGCPPARRCWPCRPGPRCCPATSGSTGDGLGASQSTRRSRCPRTGTATGEGRRR